MQKISMFRSLSNQHENVTLSYSYLDWYKSRPCPLCCSFYPLSKLRGRNFFIRWMGCNTPLPEYVLSCVFVFSIVFFWFGFSIYFVLWIWIRELGVSPTLNRGTDPRVLLDLDFLVFWFDRFQFQTSFSNILDFSWFSGVFLN